MANKIKKLNLLFGTMMFTSIFLISCKSQTQGDKKQSTISNEQAIIIFKDLIHIEPIYCLVTTIDNNECIMCIANRTGVQYDSKMYYILDSTDFIFYKLTKFADAWRVETQKSILVNSDDEKERCEFYNDFEIATIGNKPYLYFLYKLSPGGNYTDAVTLNFALFSLTDFQLTTLNYTLNEYLKTGDFTNLEKLTSKPDLSKFLENKASKSPFLQPSTSQDIDINSADNSIEDLLSSPEVQKPDYKIGDLIEFDDSEWLIVSALDNGKTLKSNNMFKDDALTEGKFITICYKVKNITNKEIRILDTPKLIDSKGREYNYYDEQAFYIPENAKDLKYAPLPPDITKKFYSVFEVPSDAKNLKFQALSLVENGDIILVNIGF